MFLLVFFLWFNKNKNLSFSLLLRCVYLLVFGNSKGECMNKYIWTLPEICSLMTHVFGNAQGCILLLNLSIYAQPLQPGRVFIFVPASCF